MNVSDRPSPTPIQTPTLTRRKAPNWEGRKGLKNRLVDAVSELPIHTQRQAWFTPDSLASYLQVSDRMIRKWVAEGRLASYKLDGCRRFDPADVDSFLAQFQDGREVTA
jgi:excisionase family DNA binding protein